MLAAFRADMKIVLQLLDDKEFLALRALHHDAGGGRTVLQRARIRCELRWLCGCMGVVRALPGVVSAAEDSCHWHPTLASDRSASPSGVSSRPPERAAP